MNNTWYVSTSYYISIVWRSCSRGWTHPTTQPSVFALFRPKLHRHAIHPGVSFWCGSAPSRVSSSQPDPDRFRARLVWAGPHADLDGHPALRERSMRGELGDWLLTLSRQRYWGHLHYHSDLLLWWCTDLDTWLLSVMMSVTYVTDEGKHPLHTFLWLHFAVWSCYRSLQWKLNPLGAGNHQEVDMHVSMIK